jgi:hypothetical protein
MNSSNRFSPVAAALAVAATITLVTVNDLVMTAHFLA